MEDLVLQARVDDHTILYVSTIARQTYDEHVNENNLGGSNGYFVIRASAREGTPNFEVLAKAASFEAAGDIFDLIVGGNRRPHSRKLDTIPEV